MFYAWCIPVKIHTYIEYRLLKCPENESALFLNEIKILWYRKYLTSINGNKDIINY